MCAAFFFQFIAAVFDLVFKFGFWALLRIRTAACSVRFRPCTDPSTLHYTSRRHGAAVIEGDYDAVVHELYWHGTV